jgi:hypothetical protein
MATTLAAGRFDIALSQRPRGSSIDVLPPRLYPGRPATIRPLARRRREASTSRVAPPWVSGWSCNEEQAGQAFYVERSQITTKSARRTKKTRAFRSNLSGGMEARFERRVR